MSAQNGQIHREASEKLRNNLLARSGIVPFNGIICKENVGMVGAEKHPNCAQS
jgi:hypothetical protein